MAAGLVVEASAGAGGRGELISLNGSAGLALGVDFAYDMVHVSAVDLAHARLGVRSAPITPDGDWHEALGAARKLVTSLIADSNRSSDRIVGVGVGVPGPVDQHRGVVGFSSNAASWVGVTVSDVAEALGAPVLLDNTSHLGLLGELAWGSAAGCRNVVYLKLGMGVGAGFLLDERLFKGAIGSAGEIGHIAVDENGPSCRCGGRGCLEVYAGAKAVLTALRPLLGDQITVDDVLRAARDGDRACARVLADVGEVVGRAVASVCNLLNPERIVVGGSLSGARSLLLEPMRTALNRRALQIATEHIEIVPAELGDEAGALGGAAVVLRQRQWWTAPGAYASPSDKSSGSTTGPTVEKADKEPFAS